MIHPGRLLHPGVQRKVAALPAGVRAEGHHCQTHPPPPGVLPALLPERLGPARPRGTPARGAVRVRVPTQSEAAFLDIADGTGGLDVITANAEAPGGATASWARRGYCRRPTRWTGRRWPLCTRLHEYNSAVPNLSCRGASTATNGQFCRHLPPPSPRYAPASAMCCRADTSGRHPEHPQRHPAGTQSRYECQRQPPRHGVRPVGAGRRAPCPTESAEPFPRFPPVPKREFPTPAVSACNRSKRTNCLQVMDRAGPNAMRRRQRAGGRLPGGI